MFQSVFRSKNYVIKILSNHSTAIKLKPSKEISLAYEYNMYSYIQYIEFMHIVLKYLCKFQTSRFGKSFDTRNILNILGTRCNE